MLLSVGGGSPGLGSPCQQHAPEQPSKTLGNTCLHSRKSLCWFGFMLLMTVCLMEMPIPDCLCFFSPACILAFFFFLIKGKGKWADCPAWGAAQTAGAVWEQGKHGECLERASGRLGEKGLHLTLPTKWKQW